MLLGVDGSALKPGLTASATGLTILLDAVIARFLLRADEAHVYFVGHQVGWVCAFRSRLGLPCPTCGMTRSLVLSLHGDVERAWRVAPAGPVLLVGLLGFATAMIILACTQCRRARRWEAAVALWLRWSVLVYAALATMVWIAGWALSFRAAWLAR